MWTPALAHYFHLQKRDMVDYSLEEYLAMTDSIPKE
jgi:hypothetical protein